MKPVVGFDIFRAALEASHPAGRVDAQQLFDELARRGREPHGPRDAALDDFAVAFHRVAGDERCNSSEALEG